MVSGAPSRTPSTPQQTPDSSDRSSRLSQVSPSVIPPSSTKNSTLPFGENPDLIAINPEGRPYGVRNERN